ncbi:MAG: T9SS type A sorting domain-containing protein [Bacteroidota bacterium]
MKKQIILFALLLTHLGSMTLAQQNTQTFTFQGFVFQTYTIPVSGYYLLTSKGGEGGSCDSHVGGKGASMSCYYFFNEGEQLRIAVAGAGQSVVNTSQQNPNGAGGGGASSIVLANGNSYLPVLIAGGGGGAGNARDGDAAQVTQIGTPGRKYDGQTGGSAGAAGGGGGSSNGAGTGGGGAGYYIDGGTCGQSIVSAWGGQAYLSGNYGGGGHPGGDGGWGGGGEGGKGAWVNNNGIVTIYYNGSGGGGGGYSGGGAGFTVSHSDDSYPLRGGSGGGGGSFISPIANTNGLVQLPGNNSGNGVVTITGPNTQTDVVNTPFNPYTWPANGESYSAAGIYTFRDSVNSVIRILDLSFGLQSCTSYTRIDTAIVSCGSYTNPINGRTYTENTTDSIRVGCVKYVARIIVAPPAALLGNMITGSTASIGTLAVCKNTSQTFTVRSVPFATSYQWTLPSGATGTSTTNSITVQFGNNFSGGNICVTPVNACGAGASVCRPITVLNTPPTGPLQITRPAAPHISGSYSVASIPGATYTWSVSNNTAIIVSGQGTSQIHLEALPGFTRANLSVRASNCIGNGSSATITLKASNASSIGPRLTAPALQNISVYPNPSNGQFTLSMPSVETDATLEVYSTEGRLVYQTIIPAQTSQTSIDLKQATAGLYQVRLVAGDELRNVKVAVQ